MSLDLSPLNPDQLEAVKSADGSILIIAGPGTGKTHTLAFRIAYLLEYKKPSTPSILAITFTNKAAQEMKERVLKLLQRPEAGVQSQKTDGSRLFTIDSRLNIGTFHALGLTILREQGYRIGLLPDFQILSESEQVEIVKEVLSDIMPQEPLNRAQKWARRLSERKNIIFNNQPRLPLTSGPPEVLISSYENRLKELNLVDFDDLILKPLILFREVPQVKAKYQNRYHYILVDEYQDINNLQYQFLKEICGLHSHLWVIGDADQAIYAFRGANVEHFFRFQQDNPGVQIINLEKSYRSTRTILTGAQSVISHNSNRIPHDLTSTSPDGLPIYLFQASDDKAEARFVIKEIEKLVGGIRMESSFAESEVFGFNEIAILYRLHHLSHPFSETLNQTGIPYQVVGGPSSHLDSPLEYLFHYLKALLNFHDDLSLQAILPVTDKRFDFQTITRLIKSGREAGCSLYTLLQHPGIDELLDPGQINSVQKLFSLLHRFQKESWSITLEQLIKNACQELVLRKQNRKMSQNEDDISEWLILAEPFLKGPAYKQLPQFLENISLWKEGETYNPQAEAVTLMTVHGAKGLEFPVVFMVGLESGIFPCTEFGEDPSDLEEERRLFYVGMTRAKKRLYLSYSRNRFLFGKNRKTAPTSFISEIPSEVIETIPDLSQSKSHKKSRVKQLSLFS